VARRMKVLSMVELDNAMLTSYGSQVAARKGSVTDPVHAGRLNYSLELGRVGSGASECW
jgi:hypothetical protein